MREAFLGKRFPDVYRPADKETVQIVEHRGATRDRGNEGRHGREDSTKILVRPALAERDESGAALADAERWFCRGMAGDPGAIEHEPCPGPPTETEH